MGHSGNGSLIASAVKGLLKALLQLIVILLAWSFRLVGLFLSKLGETLEKIIVKRH
jgi:hypothetical protein